MDDFSRLQTQAAALLAENARLTALLAERKPGVDAQTDLRKAAWYVARELERIGAGEGDG